MVELRLGVELVLGLQAKAEALGSTDYKSTVDVDDRSTGGNRAGGALEATHSRGCSETSDRGGQS